MISVRVVVLEAAAVGLSKLINTACAWVTCIKQSRKLCGIDCIDRFLHVPLAHVFFAMHRAGQP